MYMYMGLESKINISVRNITHISMWCCIQHYRTTMIFDISTDMYTVVDTTIHFSSCELMVIHMLHICFTCGRRVGGLHSSQSYS